MEQKYNFAGKFVDNYAIVQDKKLKYGVIDRKGNVIVDCKYENLDNTIELLSNMLNNISIMN